VSDQPNEAGNLIRFPRPATEPETALDESRARCSHPSFAVIDATRSVECRKCGEVLDPWSILRAYATKERAWRHYEAEAALVRRDIEELRKQRQALQASVRRAKSRDLAGARADERARILETFAAADADFARILQIVESVRGKLGPVFRACAKPDDEAAGGAS
jgi:hypothetical protein